MSNAPLFQNADDQEQEPVSGEEQDTCDETVAMPGGLMPGGMGGSAAVNSIPGVVPPGVGHRRETDEDVGEEGDPRLS